MSKGFDCATPLTAKTAALFFDQRYKFVCRYLAPSGSWKRLTANEAVICSNAGLWIVSVFERGATNALAGAAQGKDDGALALKYAKEVGQPEGTVIYAAVDTDVSSSHYNAIEEYLRSFDEQIQGYELGIYGEYEICEEMRIRGVVNKLWQTYAWSRGAKISDPNVYQYENDVIENGIGIDRDESNGDAGGWKVGMVIQQKSAILDIDVANTIINTWISPAWNDADRAQQAVEVDGDVEASVKLEEQKSYCNWLANQLRKATGQPFQ
ncbi:DUF1906 domain-containing protein [Paenibacillus sp. LMG 31461]|uniref:DUF1906 domain-containing protein n=1 Tax=Paenibacillus plantarum TaxID=2654975 RepID=A0ABX1X454_9BACL|nr:DUF1906 domain-containing protein [Paenibacillus plantarum]NOU63190.1 DUF1906 domain-containing protein [Paenibacillus plantarum]